MTALVFLVEQVALGLYILIAIGLLVMWRRWREARRAYRATYFELEREIFRYQRVNAVTGFVLLAELGLVILGVHQVVAPVIRSGGSVGQSVLPLEDLPFYTPTPPEVVFGNSPIDASGVQIAASDVPQVLATPTLTPTPVGTIDPNAPPALGCDTPGARLQVPANGMVVFEPITVIGAASTENFSFYRFELKGPPDAPPTFGNFAPLGDYTQPVSSISELGQFVPSFYQPGEYQFRLTVFDITNTLSAACTVNITISEPIPTPTPLTP